MTGGAAWTPVSSAFEPDRPASDGLGFGLNCANEKTIPWGSTTTPPLPSEFDVVFCDWLPTRLFNSYPCFGDRARFNWASNSNVRAISREAAFPH